jgi:hypothetical protein
MKVIRAWKKCLSPKLENLFWYKAKKKHPPCEQWVFNATPWGYMGSG